jgi:proteasome assembly chaperone (PAC2) family protein
MDLNVTKEFELKAEDLNDPIVLIGWPGIALVAKVAITSIKDALNAKQFLNIEFADFPPKSNVEEGRLEIPSAKVYYKERSKQNENDFFILTASYQPQTPQGVFEFADKFCKEMNEVTNGKIKMYVSTGAMVTERIRDIPFVHVCGTNTDLVNTFLKHENTKLMDTGVIAGANGILPAWAGKKGFAPGICLLAETLPLPMMTIDPRASKALVTLVRDYFKIDMTFEELNKQIEEMESAIESYKRQADHFMKEGIKDDRHGDSYFR